MPIVGNDPEGTIRCLPDEMPGKSCRLRLQQKLFHGAAKLRKNVCLICFETLLMGIRKSSSTSVPKRAALVVPTPYDNQNKHAPVESTTGQAV
jgi:hypothetical protein